MARGWHYIIQNSLYRVPFSYFFLTCALFNCSFLFVVSVFFFFFFNSRLCELRIDYLIEDG